MIISILFIMEKMIMSMSNSNFIIFWGDSVVPERNLPEKWGTLRGEGRRKNGFLREPNQPYKPDQPNERDKPLGFRKFQIE
jgi:hypothetical protein